MAFSSAVNSTRRWEQISQIFWTLEWKQSCYHFMCIVSRLLGSSIRISA